MEGGREGGGVARQSAAVLRCPGDASLCAQGGCSWVLAEHPCKQAGLFSP